MKTLKLLMRLWPISVLCFLSVVCGAQTFEFPNADKQPLTDKVAAEEFGKVTSLWIEQNGDVLYEEYFHGADSDTHHNMRSAGKTVTSALLGAAIADGKIASVNVKAASFFDELRPFDNPDSRKDDIELIDLLTMSSPLECNDWNSFSRGNEERMYLVEDWSAFFWNLPIRNRPSWEVPQDDDGFGRSYSYCTAGAQLLGEIVERATGETAAEYAAYRVFAPIGIENPKWNYASSGKAHLGGGIELTTADWAAVARLYRTGMNADGDRVLPESWINASLRDYVRIDDNTNYGFLWWRPRYEVDGKEYIANMMTGSGGNRVYLLPEFGVIAVITKNDFRDREAHPKSDRLFIDEIVARLNGGENELCH